MKVLLCTGQAMKQVKNIFVHNDSVPLFTVVMARVLLSRQNFVENCKLKVGGGGSFKRWGHAEHFFGGGGGETQGSFGIRIFCLS